MSQTNSTLAQALPVAATETTLYTVPAGTKVTPFGIKVRNSGTSVATWYIRHKSSVVGLTNAEYQIGDGDNNLQPYETRNISVFPLDPTDVITVYSSTGLVVFQLAGQVNT